MKAHDVMSKHDCAKHGHASRPGPWGPVCPWCGLPLPKRPERIEGWNGLWWELGGHSRVWVPE